MPERTHATKVLMPPTEEPTFFGSPIMDQYVFTKSTTKPS